jgi:hypothetical protein
MRRLLVLGLLALASCPPASAAISDQGPYQSATTGYVDPTVATFNGNKPLVACSGSCSAALINQNTDALQAAVNLGCAAPHPVVRIPPNVYPWFRGGTLHNQVYGVQLAGCTYLVIEAPGAELRMTGNCGQGDFYGFRFTAGTAHVRILPGLIMSGRDLTNCSEHTHGILLGDSLSDVDDVAITGMTTLESATWPGDAINLLGGYEPTHLIHRVFVGGNSFDNRRTGVSYQHGTNEVTVYGNWFVGTHFSDQLLDHEPTSPGGNRNETTMGNFFAPPNADISTAVITMSGSGPATGDQSAYAYNVILGGMQGSNVLRQWVHGNVIAIDHSISANTISLQRNVQDIWITDNDMQTDVDVSSGSVIDLLQGVGHVPIGIVIRGNRIKQYASWIPSVGNTAINADGVADLWVDENDVTYHGSAADSGLSGFIGIGFTSHVQAASGWVLSNRFAKGLQIDGVTPAGRPLVAINANSSVSTYPHDGHLVARGNVVDGFKEDYLLQQTTLDDGPPIVSETRRLNGTIENLSSPKYRIESTGGIETKASGAISPSSAVTTLLSATTNTTHTMAPGVDGGIKRLKWIAGGGSDTVTITNFGDGTSLSVTSGQAAGGAHAELAWDAAAGKWWVITTTNVTVNP